MHYSKFFGDSEYLSLKDLEHGKKYPARIEEAVQGDGYVPGKGKGKFLALRIYNTKRKLGLGKTASRTLALAFGHQVETWKDKEFLFFAGTVNGKAAICVEAKGGRAVATDAPEIEPEEAHEAEAEPAAKPHAEPADNAKLDKLARIGELLATKKLDELRAGCAEVGAWFDSTDTELLLGVTAAGSVEALAHDGSLLDCRKFLEAAKKSL